MAVVAVKAGVEEVRALQNSAATQIGTDLNLANKTASDAVALAEKHGLKSEKGYALLTLSTVQQHSDNLAGAIETAKGAGAVLKDALDTGGQGAALAIIAAIQQEQSLAIFESDQDASNKLVKAALRSATDAVKLLKEEEISVSKEALASASYSLAWAATNSNKSKEGLIAAKDAVDNYLEVGDQQGEVQAIVLLAELHVIAGGVEDWARVEKYLNMATRHTAAAGYWAERGQALAQTLGYQEGIERCQGILAQERVIKDAARRGVPFAYNTFLESVTLK